jgi:hypothetical protein
LFERLAGPETWFFVHIDRQVDARPFRAALADFDKRSAYIERVDTAWGGFGLVKATLDGLRQILASGVECDYVHLISGQDYPLCSNAAIDAFFEANRARSFIGHDRMPVNGMPHGGMDRIIRFHLFHRGRGSARRQYWLQQFEDAANAVVCDLLRHPRRFPRYLEPYVGSQWWSLAWPAVRYVLAFLDEHPDYLKFHRYTLISDEIVIQSVLGSCDQPEIRDTLVNDSLRYIDWQKPGELTYPVILRREDFPALMRSGKLWARKFDAEVDAEILREIDAAIDNRG